MHKDAPAEQLVEGIKVIANGNALLAPSMTQTLIDEIARRPGGQQEAFPGIDQLTERELDVVKLMARGMSNNEIATDSSTSARRRSRPTWGAFSPSSAPATVCKPSSPPTNPASSYPASSDEDAPSGPCLI